MPFYRLLVSGTNPALSEEIHGFFTTRTVFAADARQAEMKLRVRLTREFTVGESAAIWAGPPPVLRVEEVRRIGWLEAFTAGNRGSTFYDNRDQGRL